MFSSTDTHSVNQDIRLIGQATKAGWLTADRRGALLERAFELAATAADEGEVESFVKLARLLEAAFQFDVKRAVAERLAGKTTIVSQCVSGATLESRRAAALSRANALGLGVGQGQQ